MNNKDNKTKIENSRKKCGIIMPISPHPDYPPHHWKDVLDILQNAISSETNFEARLVSDDDDDAIGLIHGRIVNNIYNDDIIICDVSTKNPNVMFELGMRLAFDKPTIIIKDENTGYSFDTGVIEHLTYPSSLRFKDIINFKKQLAEKVMATYEKSAEDKSFSPFLKSFGTMIPAKISETEVSQSEYIISRLDTISERLLYLEKSTRGIYAIKEYSSLRMKKLTANMVSNFLDNNPKLEESFVLEHLENIFNSLVEEFEKRHGFTPPLNEIRRAVRIYFRNKEVFLS